MSKPMTPPQTGGSDREIAPAGSTVGRCFEIIYLGQEEVEWKAQKKWVPKVRISWELAEHMKVFKEGEQPKPMVVSNDFNYYMTDKSQFRPFLESWRGKPFTEDQVNSFDLTSLAGVYGIVNVIHGTSKKGRPYAAVSSVIPLVKGMTIPAPVNPVFTFDAREFTADEFNKLPKFLQDKVMKCKEVLESMQEESMRPKVIENDGQPPIPPHSDFQPNSPQPSAPLDGVQPEDGDGLPF
jgi:hypothetical protein